MPSVALIGPDGAGKTTITRMLEKSGVLRCKYLYMGVDIPASNVALPTSRLAARLRGKSNGSAHHAGASGPKRRSALRSIARLGNRLTEEWFRQLVSWWYQLRGYVVLYDRHFVFDFTREMGGAVADSLDRRIHRWCLAHLYPRPDLVIFLDAPGALLYERKRESTAAELERRRQVFLSLGSRVPGFVRVDATRPLPEVYEEVARRVLQLRQGGASAARQSAR